MQVGELFSPAVLQNLEDKCAFRENDTGPAKKPENIADDDLDDVQELQKNDGGTLGKNVEGGKKGEADGGPYAADDFVFKQAADDTNRGKGMKIHLPDFRDIKEADFPFTVAAHHLIPGNASLYDADVKLIDYMEDGGKVTSIPGKKYTIEGHIGYDVNGSHNGVWLPGNYAIKTALPKRKIKGKTYPARVGTTPIKGKSWEELSNGHEDWQFAYVAGACKATRSQFHDSHEEPYSASVRKNLIRSLLRWRRTSIQTVASARRKQKCRRHFG